MDAAGDVIDERPAGRNGSDRMRARRAVADAVGPGWHVVRCAARVARLKREPLGRFVERERAVPAHAGALALKPTAQLCLEGAGFEVYHPLLRRLARVARKRLSQAQRREALPVMRPVLTPLFPGFLFVRFDPEGSPWHDIFRTVGVHGMLTSGDVPYRLPDFVVDELRALEVGGALPERTRVAALPFARGDRVRMKEGSFTGVPALVEDLDESGRVRLLVAFLGRHVLVETTVDRIGAP